jgi:tetratricopeptide (TPR) repeat protein
MAHLTDEDLEAFLSHAPKPNDRLRVVRHLLSGCEGCQRLAARAFSAKGLAAGFQIEAIEAESIAEALPKILHTSGLIREERKRARVSFARLAPLGKDARLSALRKQGRYKKYGLALHVLDEADALVLKRRFSQAKELVHFSMAITEFLRPGIYGEGPLSDLRLHQLATFANIRRLTLDFMGALESLQEADDMRHRSIDPLEEARFLKVETALLYDLGEFERAGAVSAERAELCQVLGDSQSQAKAILQEAGILAQYKPEAGLTKADEGLSLLDPRDLYPFVCGVFNRAFCLVQLRRIDEATDYLLSHREVIRKVIDPRREIHFLWLDGKIMRQRKAYRDAEEMYSYVALRFAEEQMYQEMLLVHIDRIELRLDMGRWKSALNIARRLTPELTRLGLRNDLLSMWASFQEALSSREMVVSEVRTFYRRRWNTRTGLTLLP